MMQLYPYDPETLREILAEADAVEAGSLGEFRTRSLAHMRKRLGNPVASWEDGKSSCISADQIDVDFDQADG